MIALHEMGIELNGKHSYRDFGLYLNTRSVSFPERQSVTSTVPYMSGYYDFSFLYGGPYYGSRELIYTFDLLADTPQELETLKNRVVAWAASAAESRIYDDYDPDYFFVGSSSTAEFAEDEALPECGGVLTLRFVCQPYRRSRTTGEEVL